MVHRVSKVKRKGGFLFKYLDSLKIITRNPSFTPIEFLNIETFVILNVLNFVNLFVDEIQRKENPEKFEST